MATLYRKNDDGTTSYMINQWIRSKIAIPGNVLNNLKDVESGEIRNGWTVLNASGVERTEAYLLGSSRNYKKTRKASDI